MNYLDNLNDVGWVAFSIVLYLLALLFMVVLCKGIALADRKRPL
jgi:hypothetical protein